nr:MAG TPA: hypothetical protein [Caudoviricetes sp.]
MDRPHTQPQGRHTASARGQDPAAPPPQGTPLAVKGAGQDPARQATKYKRRCPPLSGMASQHTIE